MGRKLLASLLVLATAAAAVGGIWWWREPMRVAVVTAETGTAAEIVYASGVVEPKTWAKVTSLVRERIVGVCNCEGEQVEVGRVLVELDDMEIRARIRELQARRELAEREFDRASGLMERGIASRQAYERSQAEFAQVEASLAAIKEQASDYVITAPIAGTVLRLDAAVGEIAAPGEVLAWVGRQRPLEVVAEVNEEDIPRVDVGQRVLMRSEAFPDRVLEGEVASITLKGDPVKKTYRVRIDLPDDTPLFIGMSVDANIVIRELEDRLLLPAAALAGSTVFVVENGVVSARRVTVGIRGLETVEITEGLEPGDRVVMPAPEDLADGAEVRIVEAGS